MPFLALSTYRLNLFTLHQERFTQQGVLISLNMHARRKLSLPDADPMLRKRALTNIAEHEEGERNEGEEDKTKVNTNNNETESLEGEQEKSNLPQMHQAVLDGNVELLKELIKNGADINVLDPTGWPPMHTAIRAGRTECAAILIKQGAGEFYYNKQKQDYLKRLERCQKAGGRKISYWR